MQTLVSSTQYIDTSKQQNILFVHPLQLAGTLTMLKPQTITKFEAFKIPFEVLSIDLFITLYEVLVSGGQIDIREVEGLDDNKARSSLKISGFVNFHVEGGNIIGEKPQNFGAAPLKRKKVDEKSNEETKASTNGKSGWKITGQMNDLDNQYINEDELLIDEGEVKKFSNPSDCLTKPKACDNCTCGRAELELGAQAAQKKLEGGDIKSSCGKCYLGDAFRCAGCPYLGQPAFEPGDVLTIKLGDQSQVSAEREVVKTKTTGGKVMLDI